MKRLKQLVKRFLKWCFTVSDVENYKQSNLDTGGELPIEDDEEGNA